MFEIDVDIIFEIVDDDSQLLLFYEIDSDDKDEFGINKYYLVNEIKSGFK